MYACIFTFIQSNVYNDDSECTDLQFYLTLFILILVLRRTNLGPEIMNAWVDTYNILMRILDLYVGWCTIQ